MSGIITNPHFRKYVEAPGAVEVGTMVAVLELGALGIYMSQDFVTRTDICIQQQPLPRVGLATLLAEKALYSLVQLYSP